MLKILLSFIGVLLLAVLLDFLWTWAGAWLQTKSAPRKPMFWCQVHGPIPYDGVIKFMEHEVCGTCFHERLRNAERGKL